MSQIIGENYHFAAIVDSEVVFTAFIQENLPTAVLWAMVDSAKLELETINPTATVTVNAFQHTADTQLTHP